VTPSLSAARGAGALAVAAAALTFGATSGTAAAPTCRSAGAETVVQNRLARVYAITRGTKRHYLCTRRSGRRLWLDPPADDLDVERVGRFRLNGRSLAFQRVHVFFRARTSYTVELRDVRTRRLVRRVDAAPDGGTTGPSRPGDGVRDLVVTRGGALAWIVRNPSAPGPRLQVWRSDASGEELLDTGNGIAASSLSLDGAVVRWRNGGERRSARLQG